MLATLSHPAIVPYIAHGYMPSGNPFLVMRWLHGRDLASRLSTAPLTAAETWLLARRVCEGLSFAHARGVVHRDLKPSNLMLVDDDPAAVMLLDFGVARARGNQPLTRTGAVLGTIGYMAPEQALGELDMDARVDVFALGCLIYECLTGRLAFGARHSVAMIAKVLSAEPPQLADYDKRLGVFDPLLAKLLARDRAARPSDAGEVLKLLDTLRPSIWRLRKITPSRVQAAVSERERSVVAVLRCRVNADAALWQRIELRARAILGGGAAIEARRLNDTEQVLISSSSDAGSDVVAKLARFACSLRHEEPPLSAALVSSLMQPGPRTVLSELIEQAGTLLASEHALPGRTLLDARTAEQLRA
ncbi:MAG TPA: serine/threonine-protein kinase, partial [Polyangiales bacterium]|nr:serine/threonine-protein kinase [Polyangiales bacterium]